MAHLTVVETSIHRLEQGGDAPVSNVLNDYYRCGKDLAELPRVAKLTSRPRYFFFGGDTTCYSRLSDVAAAGANGSGSPDVLKSAVEAWAGGDLPFDPSELVENLRRERYSAHFRDEGRIINDILRRIYYCVRPLLGVSTRRHLQKARLRGWKEIGFPAWPVDATVERIHQKLLALALGARGLERAPFIWFWPDGYSSCAIMTHDVESVSGRNFCSKLMDIDESFGFHSAFQVVPENRYVVPGAFLKEITDRGFEVNVHDLKHDGRLYAERAEFERRARMINDYARAFGAQGFRSGILYRNADWYGAFDFSYDMSIPNVAHLDPQRGGCCTVMPFFIGNLVELPLTCTQDYSLFHILGDFSLSLWEQQMALIAENHGLISFIVHPDYVMESRALETYKKLLARLGLLRENGNIWTPLPRDVAAWWRARGKMELVSDGRGWRIQGEGSERARVAWATLTDGRVTYSME